MWDENGNEYIHVASDSVVSTILVMQMNAPPTSHHPKPPFPTNRKSHLRTDWKEKYAAIP